MLRITTAATVAISRKRLNSFQRPKFACHVMRFLARASVFVCLVSNAAAQVVLSDPIISGSGIDAVHHAMGLSYVLLERSSFNKFIGQLTPGFQRKNSLDATTAGQLRMLSKTRFESQQEVLSKLQPEWKDSDEERRRVLIGVVIKKDNELVEKQLAAIDELLSPRLQFALMLEFVQYERETRLLDPVVANWLELEPGEVDGMKRRITTARSFLQQHLGPNSTPFARLPDDLDKEYRHLREKIWSDLPAQKIIRCLRVCGYIGADEGLTAFLEKYPDRAEYVTAEVSAFHIAKMQMEADAEKDDAKNR